MLLHASTPRELPPKWTSSTSGFASSSDKNGSSCARVSAFRFLPRMDQLLEWAAEDEEAIVREARSGDDMTMRKGVE